MGRKEELEAMSEEDKKEDLLKNIKEHGCIRITTRQAEAFWGAALNALIDEGKVKSEFVENYVGQYSYYKVEMA